MHPATLKRSQLCRPHGSIRLLFTALSLSVFLALAVAPTALASKSAYEWAFVRLDYARKEKVQHLKRFCDRIHALALKAAHDKAVLGCFEVNLEFDRAERLGPVPNALAAEVAKLRAGFNRYYIENYFSFYDILFVDRRGRIFYTVRKEADLHADLLNGRLSGTAIARCLAKAPERERFVDFDCYGPSAKPAAFFLEPVRKEKTVVGWILLQCAINKVNTIFSGTEHLGRTGETFLVNRNGLMLTESNFIGDSTILKKRLDDRNIKTKFADRHGNRTVTDYRGYRALTSFAVVDFLTTRWLVVAKIDRGEVITQHYTRHRRYYAERLMEKLTHDPVPRLRAAAPLPGSATLRIDMDEFTKARPGEHLHTFGVSTCTGLVAAYPGQFAYMAHISPIDRVYGADGTNLVGQIINKMKSFDIYPCQKRSIDFFVVAPHLDSLLAIIDKLVAEGFLLSQIRILHNPGTHSAALTYDVGGGNLFVSWRQAGGFRSKGVHSAREASNIGQIVRRILESEQKT